MMHVVMETDHNVFNTNMHKSLTDTGTWECTFFVDPVELLNNVKILTTNQMYQFDIDVKRSHIYMDGVRMQFPTGDLLLGLLNSDDHQETSILCTQGCIGKIVCDLQFAFLPLFIAEREHISGPACCNAMQIEIKRGSNNCCTEIQISKSLRVVDVDDCTGVIHSLYTIHICMCYVFETMHQPKMMFYQVFIYSSASDASLFEIV
mgnify:CR=1 FL=1